MIPVTRREFIEACTGTVAGVTLAAAQDVPERTAAFIAESGSSTRQDGAFFVVGCLVSTAPTRHRLQLSALKKATGFARDFTFRGTDRQKMLYARAMLQYFATDAQLRYHARFVEAVSRGNAYQAVARQYEQVLTELRLPRDAQVRLRRRPSNRTAPQGWRKYRQGHSHEALRVASARKLVLDSQVSGVPDPLLDVASVLSGTLFTAVGPKGASTALKGSIEARLRTLLGLTSLRSRVVGKWEPAPMAQQER